ncbi:MAG: hypothetical protein ACREQO_11930 [Candidatus Binatia bacterium]
MAALLKQDYAKILKVGAELVMISPDSLEQHRPYSLTRFGAKLPCLYVSDSAREIAPRYGLPRVESITMAFFTIARSDTPEIIHAHRQRTGRMASHLFVTSHLDCRREKTRIKKLEAQMSACSSVLEIAIDDRSL